MKNGNKEVHNERLAVEDILHSSSRHSDEEEDCY